MPNTLNALPKMRKQLIALGVALAAALVIVTAFVCLTLYQSRQRYYANAEETSHNLALSLENFLASYFREVDLTLRHAAEEFRLQHERHGFSDAAFSDFLRSLKERVPQARSIRGSDSKGMVIYGEDVDPAHPQDLSIREFFQRARTERELVFGVPVKSRITGELVFPLIYPLTLPDGSFGGTAYVNMNNADIGELFSSLNVGPHGIISLLDKQHRILHRYPDAADAQIGSEIKLSPATLALLASSARSATYSTISARDGRERTLSMEKIGAYPAYIVVGLANDDFLAPWYGELRNDGLFLLSLYLLSAALFIGARFSLRRQHDALGNLVRKEEALQESVLALTASESRWRSLTEGLPQMIWTVTPDLQVDFLSRHWQDYTGQSEDSLRAGNTWSSIIHPDDRDQFDAAWQQARAAGAQFRCDCRLRRHDGAWRVFENYALPQKSDAGEVICWVGSSTDMTETREAHADLLRAKDEALQAGRAKSEFVANMSHEIRSPMNAVLGMLQLLQRTRMDPRQRDYASKAESAARALLGLLNDILDFSKIESGKLQFDSHAFSFDKLLRDLAAILSSNVGSKNVELVFKIDPALPDIMVGDALRIQQVLLNLCGNAVKFTEQGEVELSVHLDGHVEARAGDLRVVFSIRDTGIGIAEEHMPHLFEGFAQAEASTARRFGGTGLGLAISRRLVQLMGGELQVESALGQGSTFEFAIVLQIAAPEADAVANVRRMRDLECLVVDDNASARDVLAAMAHSFGWRVDAVDNGREAIAAVSRRAAHHPYDVMFVDWQMPELDGWETTRQIRRLAEDGIATPVIIMVTAYERELLAQKLVAEEQAGMLDGTLAKPFTASMLFNVVAEARLGQRAGVATEPPPALYRLRGMHILLVEDNPLNQQVARELLSHEGALVEVVDSGQAAIDRLQHREHPLPQVVLMDIQMPGMDGHAATRAIRAQLGALAPPIIAMTANAMEVDREAAQAAGMVDHIGKPFDLSQLVALILRHARIGEAPAIASVITPTITPMITPMIAPTIAPTAEAPPPPADFASAAALERLGGIVPLYLRTLRAFANELTSMAERLQAALDSQSAETALPILHTMKGLAGTVGAVPMATLAANAEKALTTLHSSTAGTTQSDEAAAHSDPPSGPGDGWRFVAEIIESVPRVKAAAEDLGRSMEPTGKVV
jgi:PAS domain S-box-containing protein